MPNFPFLASRDDFLVLLDLVLLETDCRVYEAVSRPNEPLRTLGSAEEVLAAYPDPREGEPARPVDLRLWSPAMGGRPVIRRVEPRRARERLLTRGTDEQRAAYSFLRRALREVERDAGLPPSRPSEAWREHCEGWALLILRPGCLSWNSEGRARGFGEDAGWNWEGVETTAKRVRSLVRGLAVTRWQSHPVLPEAAGNLPA